MFEHSPTLHQNGRATGIHLEQQRPVSKQKFGYLVPIAESLKPYSHCHWLGCLRMHNRDLLSFRIRLVASFPRCVMNLHQFIDWLVFDVRAFTEASPERSSHWNSPRATTNLCVSITGIM
ncbi:hypothetical protein AVEN_263280-1 [Araneus ventricosus]|uniref:Uncharacterized protein n=1 Tax=Araneus ventricosus TaxID=182803 RepID=A0A4Y2HIB6_ARAVE|nr:hypothetical protein AVEN_263280-1 [Araneus ventricosus]